MNKHLCYFCGREESEHYGSGKRCGVDVSYMEPQAHIIRCNDMNVCVVLGSEEDADARMDAEREAYYQRNRMVWNDLGLHKGATAEEADRKAYRQRCYWRVETHSLDGVTES